QSQRDHIKFSRSQYWNNSRWICTKRVLAQQPRFFLTMKRVQLTPRADWQAKVEKVGLTFHTFDGDLYWDESAAYEFTAREIDQLEAAANTLHELCLEAAQHVIDEELFDLLAIPAEANPHVVNSWNRDDFSLYG